MVKHHFLLFRHCIRSTSDEVDVGISGLSVNAADYIGDELPDWGVPEHWCTENGITIAQDKGAWLVKSGIVSPNSHVEIIADSEYIRDMDTAYAMSIGIQDELEDGAAVTGVDTIRENYFLFRPGDDGTCEYIETGDKRALQYRLDYLPRPDLDVAEGLRLLQEIAGTGKIGSLVSSVRNEPELDYADWTVSGGPTLLEKFGEMLFYARAGIDDTSFASQASAQQVYQLLQYHDWYRSILEVDNNWSAMGGAAWAQVALQVLERGTLYDDTTNEKDKVSIFAGHDFDLNAFTTALGVTYNLPEYNTHPEFVPTPPNSGFHLVRDTETGIVEASFLYPVFNKQATSYWLTDFTSGLKRTPLIWKNNEDGTFESTGASSTIPSLDALESHLVSTLSQFKGGVECFSATAAKLASERSEASSSPKTAQSMQGSTIANSSVLQDVVAGISLLVAVFLAGMLFCRRRNTKDYLPPTKETEDEPHEEVVMRRVI